LEDAFKALDKDGSGFIDLSEAEHVFRLVYDSPNFKGKKADDSQIKREAQEMIASMDQNKDNKVSLDEFIKYGEKAMSSGCTH
jgi:Ca2+-binding EF-hand superfamily protein